MGNIYSFKIISENLYLKNTNSVLVEYGTDYETQIAFHFFNKTNFLERKLIVKILRVDKAILFPLNNILQNTGNLIEITNIIYKEGFFDILLLLKKFKLYSKNNKQIKKFNSYDQNFYIESCDFFKSEYFFQIMNGEFFLLRKIKVFIRQNDNYNSKIQKKINFKQMSKSFLIKPNYFNNKVYSITRVFVLIRFLDRDLSKKVCEISEIILNFTWCIEKYIPKRYLGKICILKSKSFFETKLLKLGLNFLNSYKCIEKQRIINFFLISFI
nr:hypothetical protein Cry52Nrm3_p051 [Cryptomonas curvata]